METFRTLGNPYMPSWEYVPDGEPHVFGDRVYVYGSHDRFNGHAFCLEDYVCWSAPVEDLTLWTCEGIIYKKIDDPMNPDGKMCLYAPDVTRGCDGRYYLYYVLDKVAVVSVAVAARPEGPFSFYGYVRHRDGGLLGAAEGDEPQFDPGVLTEGSVTYLYTGFCPVGDASRTGPMVSLIGSDMVTLIRGPENLLPSEPYARGGSLEGGPGTGYRGHEYFEAASIRKYRGLYYFIYSSVTMHELCYATSDRPDGGFRYRGVLVSNADSYYGGNNHGSLAEIRGQWYVFYHRHTHGTTFCRQACAEPILPGPEGTFLQAEMTSQGLRCAPLPGKGLYPAYLACTLTCGVPSLYTAQTAWCDNRFPLITQEGRHGDREEGFAANMMDGAEAGFKYFDFSGTKALTVRVRGYCRGHFIASVAPGGPEAARIPVDFTNLWTDYRGDLSVPDGVHPLYLRFEGEGRASLASFALE